MTAGKVVLLDGSNAGDSTLLPLRSLIVATLQAQGDQVDVFTLCEMRVAHCIGCFGCWLETPGICILPDAGRRLSEAVINSDLTVLLTPVCFGGYSSELKKAIDRWLPLVLPYFFQLHGELHHLPRYRHYPRLVGVGVQREANAEAAGIFRAIVGRNAINFHAESYAADEIGRAHV